MRVRQCYVITLFARPGTRGRTGLGSPGHETPSGVEDGVLIRDLT